MSPKSVNYRSVKKPPSPMAPSKMANEMRPPLANRAAEEAMDVLRGAGAIADFLNEFVHPPLSRMAVYKLVSSGALPAGHLGAQVIGSKKRILAHLEHLLSRN